MNQEAHSLEKTESSNLTGFHITCLLIVLIFAYSGGAGAHFATQGLNPESYSRFRNFKLKPLVTGFIFPTLLAQLIWGAIARNGLVEYFDDYYDDHWGSWIRSAGIACILIRIGGELDFKGKGAMFMMYSTLPSILEAVVGGVISHYLLDIPWAFAISLGFLLTVCGAAIVVPPALKYREMKLSPHVCDLILSSMAFSVAFSIASWSIFNSISMIIYGNSSSGISTMIVNILEQIFAGLGAACIFSTFVMPFKNTHKYVRCAVMIVLLQILMWFFTYYSMPIGTILANIFFGFFCKFTLGTQVPTRELKYCWYFAMPFLFGHVGSQIDLRKLSAEAFEKSIAVVFVCLLARAIGSISVCSMDKRFTFKEKLYVAISSFTKATAQSSFSGTLAVLATTSEFEHLKEEGNNYLTCAVISVIIGGPLGALLMENVGVKLLTPEKTLQRKDENHARSTDASDRSILASDKKKYDLERKLLSEETLTS